MGLKAKVVSGVLEPGGEEDKRCVVGTVNIYCSFFAGAFQVEYTCTCVMCMVFCIYTNGSECRNFK